MIPLLSTVELINVLGKVSNVPTFVGIVNYYRYMWRKHTHTLAPLTKICSTKVKCKWNGLDHNAFMTTKNILGLDILLSCPDFIEIFLIHIDATKTQIGGGVN